MKLVAVTTVLFGVGCTTLGSMPSTTGISAVPAGRPGGEVQGGVLPIFLLSDAASGNEHHGESTGQLTALFEPDRLVNIPGLIVAARLFGKEDDTALEPTLGYRQRMGDVSFGAVGFGTKMSSEKDGVTYEATRVGLEGMVDARIAQLGEWFSIHAGGAINATYIKANGTYCYDVDTGLGRDCDQDDPTGGPMIDGALAGLYSAATLDLGLDFGRRATGAFHSLRLGGMFTLGHMPRLVNGRQRTGEVYISGGVALTVGFGASE